MCVGGGGTLFLSPCPVSYETTAFIQGALGLIMHQRKRHSKSRGARHPRGATTLAQATTTDARDTVQM